MRPAWREADDLHGIWGQTGVFQLADAEQQIIFIGMAGGRSRMGLRSEIAQAFASVEQARYYRAEITTAYLTRYKELLMLHEAAHGEAPPNNDPATYPSLGRLSPN